MGGGGGPPVPGLSGGSGGLPPGPPRGGSGPGRPIGGGAGDDLTLPPPTLRPEGGGGGRGPLEVRVIIDMLGDENDQRHTLYHKLFFMVCMQESPFFNSSVRAVHLCEMTMGSFQEMAASRLVEEGEALFGHVAEVEHCWRGETEF